ncbi:MAG: nicotinamide-nucleotide amidohydrolase family protein [Planctomycetaceae bacterium]|nr:MAG: nicotinamide-nucleotide amidohydrolase family protein [Planctomycetaceae bacterium]
MLTLQQNAAKLAAALASQNVKLVFAESCTGGLAAAALTAIPGVSQWFCGSAVTYQEPTKIQWLGIDPDDLEVHSAVSVRVTRAMAKGVLERTDHADLAVAVTGHLGPDSPQELDGKIFVVALARTGRLAEAPLHQAELFRRNRPDRQIEAATHVLKLTEEWVRQIGPAETQALRR